MITAAAGKLNDGNSCCFSDGMAMTPKPRITSATSATRPRLAKLSLARNDMNGSPGGYSLYCLA